MNSGFSIQGTFRSPTIIQHVLTQQSDYKTTSIVGLMSITSVIPFNQSVNVNKIYQHVDYGQNPYTIKHITPGKTPDDFRKTTIDLQSFSNYYPITITSITFDVDSTNPNYLDITVRGDFSYINFEKQWESFYGELPSNVTGVNTYSSMIDKTNISNQQIILQYPINPISSGNFQLCIYNNLYFYMYGNSVALNDSVTTLYQTAIKNNSPVINGFTDEGAYIIVTGSNLSSTFEVKIYSQNYSVDVTGPNIYNISSTSLSVVIGDLKGETPIRIIVYTTINSAYYPPIL